MMSKIPHQGKPPLPPVVSVFVSVSRKAPELVDFVTAGATVATGCAVGSLTTSVVIALASGVVTAAIVTGGIVANGATVTGGGTIGTSATAGVVIGASVD